MIFLFKVGNALITVFVTDNFVILCRFVYYLSGTGTCYGTTYYGLCGYSSTFYSKVSNGAIGCNNGKSDD
jgi:hypothetical protein